MEEHHPLSIGLLWSAISLVALKCFSTLTTLQVGLLLVHLCCAAQCCSHDCAACDACCTCACACGVNNSELLKLLHCIRCLCHQGCALGPAVCHAHHRECAQYHCQALLLTMLPARVLHAANRMCSSGGNTTRHSQTPLPPALPRLQVHQNDLTRVMTTLQYECARDSQEGVIATLLDGLADQQAKEVCGDVVMSPVACRLSSASVVGMLLGGLVDQQAKEVGGAVVASSADGGGGACGV